MKEKHNVSWDDRGPIYQIKAHEQPKSNCKRNDFMLMKMYVYTCTFLNLDISSQSWGNRAYLMKMCGGLRVE